GPIGQMCARIAQHHGARVIGVDLVPERLELAKRYGIETLSNSNGADVAETIRDMTEGRGTDSVIDALGMEAHGSPVSELMQKLTGLLPDAVAEPMMQKAGVDRLAALTASIDAVRRGGTVSIIGVYGGMKDPLPMLIMFDKQVQLRMGQANVKNWIDDVMPLVMDESDPLGTKDLATHRLPLDDAPQAYAMFQEKRDGAIKVVLQP